MRGWLDRLSDWPSVAVVAGVSIVIVVVVACVYWLAAGHFDLDPFFTYGLIFIGGATGAQASERRALRKTPACPPCDRSSSDQQGGSDTSGQDPDSR
jgi:hypothetical protein